MSIALRRNPVATRWSRVGFGNKSPGNCSIVNCFFCQAEDGIRDKLVTGVQTCALPISRAGFLQRGSVLIGGEPLHRRGMAGVLDLDRSEERRVGKECRARWSPYH